jgi:lycopene cyclase domain-containing protein
MRHYTYLLVNFFTVIFCFAFSFHPRIQFNRLFIPFIQAAAVVAAGFIVWDVWFTHIGVWWFNDTYLVGIRLLNLPLEECLFFFCIPFSCLFTWFVLHNSFAAALSWRPLNQKWFSIGFSAFCMAVCLFNTGKIYPFVTFLVTALTLLYLQLVVKANWIGEVSSVYTILLIPFFIVNGILTGTGLEAPIVNYNNAHFWNIRVLTVPLEDAVYGYTLTLWNIFFLKKFSRNSIFTA